MMRADAMNVCAHEQFASKLHASLMRSLIGLGVKKGVLF